MLYSLSTAYSHNHDHLRHRVSIGTIHFHKGHPFQAYKQVPGASQPSTPNTTSTKGKFTSDVVVKRMPSYDSTHAVTMCRSAPLLPTVQVWCHCGHTTCTEHVCNNQPGLTNSRCPCPCNALYTCLTCQNHLGSAARLPCTEAMATLSNATLHNTSFSPSKSNQMLPQQGSAKQSKSTASQLLQDCQCNTQHHVLVFLLYSYLGSYTCTMTIPSVCFSCLTLHSTYSLFL